MSERKPDLGLNHEGEHATPTSLPTERGSEKFSVTQALLGATIFAVGTYVLGEAVMAARNAGFLGMIPASDEGMVSYRIFVGLSSGLGALYGWKMMRPGGN